MSYYGGYYSGYYASYSTFDAATGYTHSHSLYMNHDGSYEHVFDEERGPSFDRTYQYTSSYSAGVRTTDALSTVTPLDGTYDSYGTRYATSYDLADHTATTTAVTFSAGHSYTAFHAIDDATGATVASYDARWSYAAGYYEATHSTYSGPGGTTYTAIGAYHPTG